MYKTCTTSWRLRPLRLRRSAPSLDPATCNDHNLTVAGDRLRGPATEKSSPWPASAPPQIGAASTAPAYSLAATLGFIVAVTGVGVHAPAVLLVSFIPMLLIAAAYKYLNRADPDAGTTFAWTTRALGPGTGWVNGWAIFLSDVLVMASLADIAGIYTFKLFGFTELSESLPAIIIAAIVWI